MRVSDPLLPQIAADFAVTRRRRLGHRHRLRAAHGSMQLVAGPIGDRFGKCRRWRRACALSCVLVLLCGLAQSLPQLDAARASSAALAAAGSSAARHGLSSATSCPTSSGSRCSAVSSPGRCSGRSFGQAAGGVLGDYFGWRTCSSCSLRCLRSPRIALASRVRVATRSRTPTAHAAERAARPDRRLRKLVLRTPWARCHRCSRSFSKARLFFGGFTYVGADLHLRFGAELHRGRPCRRRLRHRRPDLRVSRAARWCARFGAERARHRRRRAAGASAS